MDQLKDMTIRELLNEANAYIPGARLYKVPSVLRIVAISDELERRRKLDEEGGISAATTQVAECMPDVYKN